jgi:hypothetical protein
MIFSNTIMENISNEDMAFYDIVDDYYCDMQFELAYLDKWGIEGI